MECNAQVCMCMWVFTARARTALQQHVLQIRPIDDAGEGHAAVGRRRLEVKLGVPLVADAILDAIRPVARPRRVRLDLLVESLVDRAEALHRVRRELDGSAKLLKLLCPLEDRILHRRARHLEAVGEDQPADTRAGDEHVQRRLRADCVGSGRGLRACRRRRDGGRHHAGRGGEPQGAGQRHGQQESRDGMHA